MKAVLRILRRKGSKRETPFYTRDCLLDRVAHIGDFRLFHVWSDEGCALRSGIKTGYQEVRSIAEDDLILLRGNHRTDWVTT